MFKSLAVSALMLGSVLAVAPQMASASDRDDYYRYDRDSRWDRHRRHEAEERRERELRRERERRYYNGYYNNGYGYSNGYYNNNNRGYYDRWGNWHWY